LADYRAKIQRQGQAVLQTGESILATARAAVDGSPFAILGGLPAVLALSLSERSDARAKGFPASGQMVLAVSDRRLLVFELPVFRRPPKFRGEVPFEALENVSLRGGLNPRFRFVLASGAEVTFTTYRLDHPEEFTRVLNRARQTRAAAPSVAQSPSTPVVPPPPPL